MNTIPQVLNDRVIRGSAITNVLLVVAGSAIIALAAQIAIPVPFTPVPLTMQPLAVLLVGVTLGSRRGSAAAIAIFTMSARTNGATPAANATRALLSIASHENPNA